jgi:hypothetical protein
MMIVRNLVNSPPMIMFVVILNVIANARAFLKDTPP